jgi:uncharacterized protein
MDYPHFKYHPNAYKLNLFEKEDGICSICNEQRDLKYVCSFYSVDEPDYICPWCIANGAAAQKYNGEYNDYASVEGVSANPNIPSTIDAQCLDEICMRTPSYHSWQQEVWLIHCNEPCKFIGYANSEMLQPIWDEVKADIEDNGYPMELIQHHLTIDGDLAGYLFQCLHCKQHRLHLDCS